MKRGSKWELVSIVALIVMSSLLAFSMYRQEKTVMMILWIAVAILHMIRLGIIIGKNRKGDREE